MTAGQPQPLQTYQELVNRLYQQSNYDFVGIALQAPVSPHLTRWLFVADYLNGKSHVSTSLCKAIGSVECGIVQKQVVVCRLAKDPERSVPFG